MKKIPAFTLIEILVVATIIIVLTTISIGSFSTASKSARDAKRKSDIESVRQALVLYKTQVGNYPTATDFTGVTGALVPSYLSPPAPVDPGSLAYTGTSSQATAKFCICADVELNKGNKDTTNCATNDWRSDSLGGFYCAQQP